MGSLVVVGCDGPLSVVICAIDAAPSESRLIVCAWRGVLGQDCSVQDVDHHCTARIKRE